MPCGFFFLLSFFFLAYSQPSQIVCLPYFHTWCGLSANLECMSEMCGTRLAANTGCKKSSKNRHLGTIAQLCRATSSQLRHASTIGKKLVKQQYPLHMFSQYGELRPIITYQLRSVYQFGEPQQISTGFTSCLRYCSNVAHRRPTKLCTMFGRLLGCTHFRRLLPPHGILPGAKFTLRPSLAFSYIGSVTARHSSSRRQPNLAAWYKEWNYVTFAQTAPPIFGWAAITWHRPTF